MQIQDVMVSPFSQPANPRQREIGHRSLHDCSWLQCAMLSTDAHCQEGLQSHAAVPHKCRLMPLSILAAQTKSASETLESRLSQRECEGRRWTILGSVMDRWPKMASARSRRAWQPSTTYPSNVVSTCTSASQVCVHGAVLLFPMTIF